MFSNSLKVINLIQELTMVLVFILGMNDVDDVANLITFSLAIGVKNDTIEGDSD